MQTRRINAWPLALGLSALSVGCASSAVQVDRSIVQGSVITGDSRVVVSLAPSLGIGDAVVAAAASAATAVLQRDSTGSQLTAVRQAAVDQALAVAKTQSGSSGNELSQDQLIALREAIASGVADATGN